MMYSPDEYYEYQLKGKDTAQIMTKIRGLKREINRLICVLEDPNYIVTRAPGEVVQLSCARKYLEEAKRALIEAGGTYAPSKAEQKAADFTANLPFLSQIDFSYGGLFSGGYRKTFTFENGLRAYKQDYLPLGDQTEVSISYTKDDFLNHLAQLHIGQWRKHYDLYRFGMAVMDGYSWELTFRFSNGHRTVKYSGDNAYPYNFGDLLELFEAPWLGMTEYPDNEDA